MKYVTSKTTDKEYIEMLRKEDPIVDVCITDLERRVEELEDRIRTAVKGIKEALNRYSI